MDIVKQLVLNKEPHSVPNGSMCYAENIRLSDDGYSLIADDGLASAIMTEADFTMYNDVYITPQIKNIPNIGRVYELEGRIVGNINCPTEIVIFTFDDDEGVSRIYRAQEINLPTGEVKLLLNEVASAWEYSGGEISGTYTYNVNNELIVSIGEYNAPNDQDIPLKVINLNISSKDDVEDSYYTAPRVPIANLNKVGYVYGNYMPLGIYYFFIQYNINEKNDDWTDWFPIGVPHYAVNYDKKTLFSDNTTGTASGNNVVASPTKYSKYVNNIHKDTSLNFKFSLYIQPNNYKRFRIGYILQHKDAIVARRWKIFEIDGTTKDFIFDASNPTEIGLDEIIRNPVDINNVKCQTNYFNRLYISNFKEQDPNDTSVDVKQFVKSVDLYNTDGESKRIYTYVAPGVTPSPSKNKHKSPSGIDVNKIRYTVRTNNGSFTCTSEDTIETLLNNKDFIKSLDPSCFIPMGISPDNWKLNVGVKPLEHNDLGLGIRNGNNDSIYGIDRFIEIEDLDFYDNGKCYLPTNKDHIAGKSDIVSQQLIDVLQLYSTGISSHFTPINIYTKKFDGNHLVSNKHMRFEYDIQGGDVLYADSIYVRATFGGKNFDKYGSSFILDDHGNPHGDIFCETNGNDWDYGENENKTFTATANKKYWIFFVIDLQYMEFVAKVDDQGYSDDAEDENGNSDTILVNGNIHIGYTRTLNYFDVYELYAHYVHNNGSITNGVKICEFSSDDLGNLDDLDNTNDLGSGTVKYNLDNPSTLRLSIITQNLNSSDMLAKYNGITFSYRVKRKRFLYTAKVITKSSSSISAICLEARSKVEKAVGTKIYFSYESNDETHYHIEDNVIINHRIGEDCGYDDRLIITKPNAGTFSHIPGNTIVVLTDVDNSSEDVVETTWIGQAMCQDYVNEILSNVATSAEINTWGHFQKLDVNYPAFRLLEEDFYYKYAIDLGTGSPHRTSSYDNAGDMYIPSDTAIEYGFYQKPAYLQVYSITKFSNYNLNALNIQREPDNYSLLGKVVLSESSGTYTLGNSEIVYKVTYVNQINTIDLYTLNPMYLEHNHKALYSVDQIKRDADYTNILRRSNVIADESQFTNWRMFSASDYRVVSNQYGNIVNLVSLGNNLIIHTEHGLLTISGNSVLEEQSGNNIQVTNSDLFKLPIHNIISGDVGYGGLQDKYAWTINQRGYFFFDKNAKKILKFDGSQLDDLTLDVEGFILYELYNIVDAIFLTDYKRDRILMYFINNAGDPEYITLTYSLKVNKYISINTELPTGIKRQIFTRNNCYIEGGLISTIATFNKYVTKASNPTIEIVFNDNYNIIKVLNAISYVLYKTGMYTLGGYLGQKNLSLFNPNSFRVYTDSCDTGDYDVKINNNQITIANINQYNAYNKPYYNKGVWNFSYFRDKKNETDLTNGQYNKPDDQSLIYGKYFIIRFVFDTTGLTNDSNFALQTLDINTNIY